LAAAARYPREVSAITPPSRLGLWREPFGVLELPRLLWNARDLARVPRGAGEPVMVLPGYSASDASTFLLRSYLQLLGYSVFGWGLGRNSGNVPVLIPRVVGRVDSLAAQTGQNVRLVGWSLGGYLAREAARERPSKIERVVTLGSPVVGGPKYTVVGRYYAQQGYDLDEIEAAVAKRDRTPLRVPVTAVYSRADGVVAWRACIDSTNEGVEHVEVTTTHLGLGLAPEVYRVIAERLARRRRNEKRKGGRNR
jgi:pimeloyl-ACP methyl ester carboxylesterase